MIVNHLIVETFGCHIGKHSERLKVTHKEGVLQEAPLLHLQSILISGRGVSISADTVEACCERGIPIHFVDPTGYVYASVMSNGLNGTALTRRAQLDAYTSPRGVHFACAVVDGKISNQAITLKYLAKNRAESDPEVFDALRIAAAEVQDHSATIDLLRSGELDDIRAALMGAEGSAARRYWQAAGVLFPKEYGWPGRKTRGARDPINSLLNYGYGILYGQIAQAVVLAGLDLYAGFLHADRSGKPSLVLDLIEEFRQVAVDRLVFGLINRNFKVDQDAQGLLDGETRKRLADKVLEHLESEVRHQGKRYELRTVIQMQARELASFVRGERDQYTAFKISW
ncbi:MAG: CRISPR-associated endonuclease Cas1 [Caldilineaceae bacterium]|nr:CRISPR-associated endonuclease Cas1 [Caldilineaceae bacterium]OQY83650.1 MAG: CRISPR-associated endonuclease Cas1 [Anaerolineae bacterium UTCFX5]GIK29993.1 MAG: CRISPR-associated endonuclease Cas1 [Chloroflexota bacterium]